MARAKYYYNPKTLKYERARWSMSGILSTVVGLLCFGALFFLGLFYLQNKLIDTPAERALREENNALKTHHKVLAARLETSKSAFTDLVTKENSLHEKFFETSREVVEEKQDATAILVGTREDFEKTVASLTQRYQDSHFKAALNNDHYSRFASVTRHDMAQIRSFPGALPVENADAKMLVSGFGTRINPWHKARFHHDGVDFAGVRGSDILATGEGTVILAKESNLPAGFGSYIEIDHGYGYVTRYTHLGLLKVRTGQRVKKGSVIAEMGMSGGSIAPHVHYEVLKDGHQIDPMKVLVEGLGSDQFHLMAKAARQPNQSLD